MWGGGGISDGDVGEVPREGDMHRRRGERTEESVGAVGGTGRRGEEKIESNVTGARGRVSESQDQVRSNGEPLGIINLKSLVERSVSRRGENGRVASEEPATGREAIQ